MNKKGFTLVELLAVIAILAILVIIALPNVMGMFNSAKKNSFATETKQIYKVAQQQWMNDSMFSTGDREYGRCDGCSYKELELSGRTELKYYIKINQAGNIIKYTTDDGTYRFDYSGPGLLVEDIKDELINPSSGENVVNTRIVYAFNTLGIAPGMELPSTYTTYDNYNDAINAAYSSNNFSFLKLVLDGNIINDISIGILVNGNVYYLKNGSSDYSNNKQILESLYGSSCNGDGYYYCKIDPNSANYIMVESNGQIDICIDCFGCGFFEGLFRCNNSACS